MVVGGSKPGNVVEAHESTYAVFIAFFPATQHQQQQLNKQLEQLQGRGPTTPPLPISGQICCWGESRKI